MLEKCVVPSYLKDLSTRQVGDKYPIVRNKIPECGNIGIEVSDMSYVPRYTDDAVFVRSCSWERLARRVGNESHLENLIQLFFFKGKLVCRR